MAKRLYDVVIVIMISLLLAKIYFFNLNIDMCNTNPDLEKCKDKIATITGNFIAISGENDLPNINYVTKNDQKVIIESTNNIDCKNGIKVTGELYKNFENCNSPDENVCNELSTYSIRANEYQCIE